MPTHYLYGTILTGEGVAANNRGDNIGNITTLQKVFVKDELHTSVSGEAIRFALRYRFQLEDPDSVNRTFEDGKLNFKDSGRSYWAPGNEIYIDDALMGFMDVKAAQQENEAAWEDLDEAEEKPKSKSKSKSKGKVTKHQSPLVVSRAVSLRPYRGEISFNAVSGEKQKGKLSLYSTEMHTSEYQYSFGLNLSDVARKKYIAQFLAAVIDPPTVAGNHARFAYDFSPASIVLRITSAHSPKIHYIFEHDKANRAYTIQRLIQRVEAEDIPAQELIVGGEVAMTVEGQNLKELGIEVVPGVCSAGHVALQRIANLGEEFREIL